MQNRQKFLTVSVNEAGKRQSNLSTGLANADHDKRIKVTVEVEDVLTTEQDRDCQDVDLVDETVDTRLKRATWTFAKITPFWVAWFLAFFLGAAAEPDEDGDLNLHALTRSASDDLPAFSFVDCFEDLVSTAQKFIGHKVESISIQFPFRQYLTMTVVTTGRFDVTDVVSFDLPDCENLKGTKSYDCKILIDGVDYSALLYALTITLNNNMPITPEDNFGFVGQDLQVLERGDQPSYTLSPQFLIKKGHALHTLAKNRTKKPVVVQIGADDSERVVMTFPNVLLALNARWRQFVGQLRQPSTVIDATPMKDETLGAPLKADAYLESETQFLLT